MTAPLTYFERRAETYDDEFTHHPAGRWLRDTVQARVLPLTHANGNVLEIGCGTGVDAVFFAANGRVVTATDAAPSMLAVARRNAESAGQSERITHLEWDIREAAPAAIESLPPQQLIFSNFGALNCVEPTAELSAMLAARLDEGGYLALVVMGPYCPWELVWHAAHGDFSTAVRRLGGPVQEADGLVVQYASSTALAQTFNRDFEKVSVTGIGIFLPPSYAFHCVDRFPRMFDRFLRYERRVADRWPFNQLNDHYLIVLRKRPRTSVVCPP